MLESGNLLIRMKYDIALIEQATLGGINPPPPQGYDVTCTSFYM